MAGDASSVPQVPVGKRPSQSSQAEPDRQQRRPGGLVIPVLLVLAVAVAGAAYLTRSPQTVDQTQPTTARVTPSRALTSAEIRELFSDTTVTGFHHVQNFSFRHYYAPDGTLESMRSDQEPAMGTWRITAGGDLCVELRGRGDLCRAIIAEGGVYKKALRKGGGEKLIVTYESFSPGRRPPSPSN